MNFQADEKNLRLDKFLSTKLNISRNQILQFIKKNGVLIHDKMIYKPSFLLEFGDIVSVDLNVPQEAQKPSEYEVDFDVEILYEDDDLLVLNKPPSVTVHQAPSVKEATIVDWLKKKGFHLSTLSGEERHGIVHRIDKQTSGALMVAKNNRAHEALSNQLQDKSLGRYYIALIDNELKQNCIIDKPIARSRTNRLKMDVLQGGKEAKSAFCSLLFNESEKVNLIAAKLFTGRTHQIRVHLKSISRHILGDDLYGFKSHKNIISRVMLHAYILYFIHPISKQKIFVKAPLFDDFIRMNEKYFKRTDLENAIFQNNIIERFSDTSDWLYRKS